MPKYLAPDERRIDAKSGDILVEHPRADSVPPVQGGLSEETLALLRAIPAGVLLDMLGHDWDYGWIGTNWMVRGVVAVGISTRPIGDMEQVMVVRSEAR